MSVKLEDYALISNCHSAALVSREGSIDWLCFPRFDSGACFASLLGNEEHGRWLITPSNECKITRNYIEGTMVLETTFQTSTGVCTMTDCMLIGAEHPTLVRLIKGVSGEVKLKTDIAVRFDYGSIVPWVTRGNGEPLSLKAVAGPDALMFNSPVELKGKGLRTVGEFTVREGERAPFVLTWYPSHKPDPYPIASAALAIRKSIYWWKEWSDRSGYNDIDAPGVRRSLLTLKALTYEPSGGIIAAPTTSIPESLGGSRNWDYRYSWLRDSTFTLTALLGAGHREEAARWNEWLLRAVAGTPDQVNIMYGITGERRLTEMELDWLPGYENSKPVRIGNDAHRQTQIDVFGEILTTAYSARQSGLRFSRATWKIEAQMLNHLRSLWREPDEGIWEIRGPKRHFTHSKMMAWVAMDRAVKSVRQYKLEGPVAEWEKLRDKIHKDICENGFDRKRNTFVQSYGSKEVDASLLMMGLVGFLPPDDPRLVGTVDAIKRELHRDGLITRYRPESGIDGIGGDEGTFLACTFWLADNYVLMNRLDEAREQFDHLLTFRNDLGLYSEEYCTKTKRMVGNFPQAFSHIAHVNSAINISEAKKKRRRPEDLKSA